MHYEGNIIRPPSEAESILLQVTKGCSYNKCTFCGVYADKKFSITDSAIIEQDLKYASVYCRNQQRVFLCDGDALIIPQEKLLALLDMINRYLPWISRVGTYANAKSLSRKSEGELRALREKGLRIIHLGLESGDDVTLESICKWGNAKTITEECRKTARAGINLFITVILGIAGRERSTIHAIRTGEVLSEIDPGYVGSLSYMPVEETPLHEKLTNGSFSLLTPQESLIELRTMIEHTNMSHGYFYANHASNYLPLRIRLPRDKESALMTIDKALKGSISLTPEWMRGL